MGDIYSTPAWASSTVYNKNDFVTNGDYNYYATRNHTSTSNFTTDLNNGLWNGVITINGVKKPYFFWQPSYGYSFDIKPVVKTIQFGDSYSQSIADGINNILLPFNVRFDDRDLAEYSAILHFLNSRAGWEKFYFVPPAPFNVTKLFICPEWSPTQEFYGRYSISARFEEKI